MVATVLPFGLPAPFYTGPSGAAQIPGLYTVAIGGHPYLIELEQYQRRTLPALRQAQDISASPGEAALSTEGAWAKFQQDWHLGAGRDYFDDDDQDLPVRRRRFYASLGVDIWTRNQLTLLADTEQVELVDGGDAGLLATHSHLYLWDDDSLRVAADPRATWTVVSGVPATVYGATSDGEHVYVATSAAIMRTVIGANSAAAFGVYGDAVYGVEFANGRLVAGIEDGKLVEVAADGSHIDITTHFNDTFRWSVLATGPTKIYAGGATQGVTTLRRIGVDDTGALVDEGPAATFPPGEALQAMVVVAGVAVLATNFGVHYAQIDDQGGLQYGPVIEEPGSVRALAAERAYVWFNWDDVDADHTGLGRLNLETLANQFTPAFTTDVMAHEQGPVTAVARYGEETWFIVADEGLYGETELRVPTGVLDVGWIDYGIPYDKVWTSLDLRHAPLVAGEAIAISFANAVDHVVAEGVVNTPGATRPASRIRLGANRGERARLRLTLTTTGLTGPTLQRWLMRAFAAPDRTDEIALPIVLHQTLFLGPGQGQPEPMDTLVEYRYLQSLSGTGQIVLYQEGSQTVLVKVSQLQLGPTSWNDDRTFLEAILTVLLQTV